MGKQIVYITLCGVPCENTSHTYELLVQVRDAQIMWLLNAMPLAPL